jgi:hypothetical protein
MPNLMPELVSGQLQTVNGPVIFYYINVAIKHIVAAAAWFDPDFIYQIAPVFKIAL